MYSALINGVIINLTKSNYDTYIMMCIIITELHGKQAKMKHTLHKGRFLYYGGKYIILLL